MAHDPATDTRHLTFRVGGSHLALAIACVREVTRMPRLSRVPRAPPALLGLANFRGTVIPVLSAAALLDGSQSKSSRLIVIDTGELLGLAVDDASQVLSSDEAQAAKLIDVAELAAQMMPERATPRHSHEATTALLAEVASNDAKTSLVIFAIGDQEFALPAAVVDCIAPLPADIALLPEADDVVIGSAALGDAVLPLLSLRALLALPRSALVTRSRVVVMHIGDDRIGLVVDAMRGIMQVADDLIDPLPQALRRGHAEARIRAICRLDSGQRLVSILAADQLLRDDITVKMVTHAPAEPGDRIHESTAQTEQLLIFQIGSDEFAIPIGAVDEVAQLPDKLTRLPNTPAFVMGVMNLRGAVIPVIDQGQRFGARPYTGSRGRVIVVRIGELHAGFVVDAISQIVRIDAADVRPAPDLGNSETLVFERVANLVSERRLILIISPRALLDSAEQDLLLGLAQKGARRKGVGAQ